VNADCKADGLKYYDELKVAELRDSLKNDFFPILIAGTRSAMRCNCSTSGAAKGNDYHGRPVAPGAFFESIWFQFAHASGDTDATWNFQERNKCGDVSKGSPVRRGSMAGSLAI